MNKLIYLIPLMAILTFHGVLANGLVVNQTSTSVNKLYDQNITLDFTITNTEPFAFYNISTMNSSLITMPIIATLASGQTASVSGIVTTNSPIQNAPISVLGYYQASVGVSNISHNVNVNWNDGVFPCSFSIVKGDTVKYINQVPSSVIMRNADNGLDITIIQQNQNYTSQFTNAQTLRYYFIRQGIVLNNGQTCVLTVLPDSGIINNPVYNGLLALSVSIDFFPTTLSMSLLQNNYTMDVLDTSQQGALTLTNNGNQTAHNVILAAKWFTFSPNTFDLSPGQTRAIVYSIRAIPGSTAETNITNVIPLTVKGNFPDVNGIFNVFLNFANIGTGGALNESQSLQEAINKLCRENPQLSFCQNGNNIVFVGNNTDASFNVSMGEAQMREFLIGVIDMQDAIKKMNNIQKEYLDSLNGTQSIQANDTTALKNDVADLKQTQSSKEAQQANILYSLSLILVLGGLSFIYFMVKKSKNHQKSQRWELNTYGG